MQTNKIKYDTYVMYMPIPPHYSFQWNAAKILISSTMELKSCMALLDIT